LPLESAQEAKPKISGILISIKYTCHNSPLLLDVARGESDHSGVNPVGLRPWFGWYGHASPPADVPPSIQHPSNQRATSFTLTMVSEKTKAPLDFYFNYSSGLQFE
jgi:hypothetical protein